MSDQKPPRNQFSKVQDLQPGDVITTPGFIVKGYGSYTHCESQLNDNNYKTVMPFDLTFTVPEGFNGVVAAVNGVNSAIEKLKDGYHATLAELLKQKEELLMIGHSGESADVLDAPTDAAVRAQEQVIEVMEVDDDFCF